MDVMDVSRRLANESDGGTSVTAMVDGWWQSMVDPDPGADSTGAYQTA